MTYRFATLITKEDDWYVARCPDLGVTSQGRNVETARANLREAIELYLETWQFARSEIGGCCRSSLVNFLLPSRPRKHD